MSVVDATDTTDAVGAVKTAAPIKGRLRVVCALMGLKLKAQRALLPLLLVVVAFQLILGQASSAALVDREPPLSIAVQQQSNDAFSDELIVTLAAVPYLDLIEVERELEPGSVLSRHRVQGLLVVPADFDARIVRGERSLVMFYPAPGVTNSDFAREQIGDAIVQMRARYELERALRDSGANAVMADDVIATDLLDVVYEGPLMQSNPREAAPVLGASALLVLLAYLHAALTVPTREDKRLLARGRHAFIQQFCASMLVVWLIWLLIVALYFASLTLLFGAPFSLLYALGFPTIMLYVSLLAALFAQVLGRHAASWVFLPLFILNMTVGGGLWGNVILSPVLAPLVPVTLVTATGATALLGAASLGLAAMVIFAALVLVIRTKIRPRSRPI